MSAGPSPELGGFRGGGTPPSRTWERGRLAGPSGVKPPEADKREAARPLLGCQLQREALPSGL